MQSKQCASIGVQTDAAEAVSSPCAASTSEKTLRTQLASSHALQQSLQTQLNKKQQVNVQLCAQLMRLERQMQINQMHDAKSIHSSPRVQMHSRHASNSQSLNHSHSQLEIVNEQKEQPQPQPRQSPRLQSQRPSTIAHSQTQPMASPSKTPVKQSIVPALPSFASTSTPAHAPLTAQLNRIKASGIKSKSKSLTKPLDRYAQYDQPKPRKWH